MVVNERAADPQRAFRRAVETAQRALRHALDRADFSQAKEKGRGRKRDGSPPLQPVDTRIERYGWEASSWANVDPEPVVDRDRRCADDASQRREDEPAEET